MSRRIAGIALAVCTVIPFSSVHSKNVTAGTMLDKVFFWNHPDIALDTLEWDKAETAVCGKIVSSENNPPAAAGALAEAGKTIYFLEKPTAMCVAILQDLGYTIVALTQWNSNPEGTIDINAPGFDDGYRSRRLITHCYWEILDSVDARKPEGQEDDYTLRLFFVNGASSLYSAKDLVYRISAQVIGTTDGVVLQFVGDHAQDQKINRRILSLYLITDHKKKSSRIISELEKTMDKIGLDLTYKTPKFVKIK